MSSYAEKRRKLQEEEEKAKAVTSVIVQFQTADVFIFSLAYYIGRTKGTTNRYSKQFNSLSIGRIAESAY